MDVVFALGEATAIEVQTRLPDPPGNASVRTTLRKLEEKGYLTHRKSGRRFVYLPSRSPDQTGRSAFQHLVDVFFGGSKPAAVAAMVDMSAAELTSEELDALARVIEKAKGKGEPPDPRSSVEALNG